MTIAEGFPGQRLCVVPASAVDGAGDAPPTSRLLVTMAGWYPAAHRHAYQRDPGIAEHIVIVCGRGAGWCRVGGGVTHQVRAGQVILLPAGVPHAYGASSVDPWTISWMHVVGSDVSRLVAASGASVTGPVLVPGSVDGLVDLIDEVLSYLEQDDTTPNLISAAGAAWHLFSLLVAGSQAEVPEDDPVRRGVDYLAGHLDRVVPVAEVAREAGLSVSHFAAVFRQTTGSAVLNYHIRLRMARARTLLDGTDLPVAEVAVRCGYGDPFYFSRHFHKVHGVSPSRYRRQPKG